MIYIGIDPGLTGAVAIIRPRGEDNPPLVEFHDAPTYNEKVGRKMRKRYDRLAMFGLLKGYSGENCYAVIESLHAMPKNGGSSNFASGYGFGLWTAILTALCIPFDEVPPQRWKKLIGITHADSDADKKGLDRMRARALFPQAAKDMARVMDHGRADALLIAEYGRRTRSGK